MNCPSWSENSNFEYIFHRVHPFKTDWGAWNSTVLSYTRTSTNTTIQITRTLHNSDMIYICWVIIEVSLTRKYLYYRPPQLHCNFSSHLSRILTKNCNLNRRLLFDSYMCVPWHYYFTYLHLFSFFRSIFSWYLWGKSFSWADSLYAIQTYSLNDVLFN